MWDKIGKEVVEGNVYMIETFNVRDPGGNLKPVSSDNNVRCTNEITFRPCPDDLMIPLHKFEFLDLGDLFAEAGLLAPNHTLEFAIGMY